MTDIEKEIEKLKQDNFNTWCLEEMSQHEADSVRLAIVRAVDACAKHFLTDRRKLEAEINILNDRLSISRALVQDLLSKCSDSNKQLAEKDMQEAINSWYFRYKELKTILAEKDAEIKRLEDETKYSKIVFCPKCQFLVDKHHRESHGLRKKIVRCKKCRELARAELKFLRSLLPKKREVKS